MLKICILFRLSKKCFCFESSILYFLKSQTINHFARKFEPIVNQRIINLLDDWLYGGQSNISHDTYWENFYHFRDDNMTKFDVQLTFLQSFARITAHTLSLNNSVDCSYVPVWKVREATYLQINDTLKGVLTLFDVRVAHNNTDAMKRKEIFTVEALFKPKDLTRLFNGEMEAPATRLKALKVRRVVVLILSNTREFYCLSAWDFSSINIIIIYYY